MLVIWRLGRYCLSSPISCLQFLVLSWTPLIITGIVILCRGFGRTGVPREGSEEPGLGWLGSVGELLRLTFLVFTINLSEFVLLSDR